jgi:hypothetical protein
MDETPAAIPWYKSSALRGLLVVLVVGILKHFKIGDMFSQDVVGTIVDDALDVVGAIGVAIAAHARVTQKSAPKITLTNSAAVAINKPVEGDKK